MDPLPNAGTMAPGMNLRHGRAFRALKRYTFAGILTAAASVTVAAGLFGCTGDGSADATNDPLEPINRDNFAINQILDSNAIQPIAAFYNAAMPEPAQEGVHNLLLNLKLPATFGNDLLQCEVTRSAQTLGRFTINSTVGVGGLVDVAGEIGIPGHHADFGETLAMYGVDEGPYLILPLLGPSTLRDAAGKVADAFLDPLTYISFAGSTYFLVGRNGLEVVDARARNMNTIDDLERSSLDFYATVRSAYRQHRNAEVKSGESRFDNLPDF